MQNEIVIKNKFEMKTEIEERLDKILPKCKFEFETGSDSVRYLLFCYVDKSNKNKSVLCKFYLNRSPGYEDYIITDLKFSDYIYSNYSDPKCEYKGSLFHGILIKEENKFIIKEALYLSGVNLCSFSKENVLQDFLLPLFDSNQTLMRYYDDGNSNYKFILKDVEECRAIGPQGILETPCKEFTLVKGSVNSEIYYLEEIALATSLAVTLETEPMLALIPSLECSRIIREKIKGKESLKVKCKYHSEFNKWYPCGFV